ncbi:MAG: hypothetical protein K2R98_25995 [Gemmataceae bacterium]|nr:hypothetical protein [Gemmataceae bacterium]
MQRTPLFLAAAILLTCISITQAQPTLPLVDEVEFAPLREQCLRVLKALEARKAPLPAEVEKELRDLLRDGGKDKEAAEKIQRLLDARCLCGVTINPESRVKATRGPLTAELIRDRPTLVLIKVHNDAGVTAGLAIEGPQIRIDGKPAEGRWLDATVASEAPLSKRLSGQKLDYVIVRLTGHEEGKREATLRFDVGQGTQDLGFRAEVPILFTVRNK